MLADVGYSGTTDEIVLSECWRIKTVLNSCLMQRMFAVEKLTREVFSLNIERLNYSYSTFGGEDDNDSRMKLFFPDAERSNDFYSTSAGDDVEVSMLQTRLFRVPKICMPFGSQHKKRSLGITDYTFVRSKHEGPLRDLRVWAWDFEAN